MTTTRTPLSSEGKVDMPLFWISVISIVAVCCLILINPEKSNVFFDYLFSFVTGQFGIVYLWMGIGSIVLLLWLMFSKYGNIRMGDEKPDFSTVQWFGLMFTAGIACNVLLWGTVEWAFYYGTPPLGIEAKTVMAGEYAAVYPLFHWGPTPWAFYAIMGIPMAYFFWIKKRPILRLSTSCEPILGRFAHGWIGTLIDVFFVFGAISGIGTSMGLGTPMVSACINSLTGIPDGFGLQIGVVLAWAAVFVTVVFFGLEKGMAKLSDFNVYLTIGFIIFIIVAGPTMFILTTFTNSMGIFFSDFIKMSLWTDPIAKSGFPESWTMFYWAWWLVYAPFIGMFIAKVSKGRTIREMIVACLVGGTLGLWIFFVVLGNTGMYYELKEGLALSQIIKDQGMAQAIVAFIDKLPMSNLVLVVWIVLAFVFMATTLASSAYSLGASTSVELIGDQEPARWNRTFWAFVISTVALTLMSLGGLKVLQVASLVGALPLIFITFFVVVSFMKTLFADYKSVSREAIEKGYQPPEQGITGTSEVKTDINVDESVTA